MAPGNYSPLVSCSLPSLGGEERHWMARFREPVLGRPWLIDVMRADGARPRKSAEFLTLVTKNSPPIISGHASIRS